MTWTRRLVYGMTLLLIWVVAAVGLSRPATTQATAVTTVQGLTADDASIFDFNNNPVANSPSMTVSNFYTVTYNWSIPENTKIASGDTAPVALPSYLQANDDLSLQVQDSTGIVIGIFKIAKGAQTGTITFNATVGQAVKTYRGVLSFTTNGTMPDAPGALPDVNIVGWIFSRSINGAPSELTWNIAVNMNTKELNDVIVTQQIGPNETLIPTSVYAPTGSYAPGTSNFINDGGTVQPKISETSHGSAGSTVIYDFGNMTKAVNMTVQVKLSNVQASTVNKWTSAAMLASTETVTANVPAYVQWGGTGSISSDQLGSVTLTKTTDQGQDLPGAVFSLLDNGGRVEETGLTTDAKGQITLPSVYIGTYQFVETQAPNGYKLDQTPHWFTITQGSSVTTPGSHETVAVADAASPYTGQATLTKVDTTTSQVLAGAEYKLTDSSGQTVASGMTTNQVGQVTVGSLANGTYNFVETKAPVGYALNPQAVPVTITNAAQNATVTAQDTPISNTISGTVWRDNNGDGLMADNEARLTGLPLVLINAATHAIVGADGTGLAYAITTDSMGRYQFSNIPAGTYQVGILVDNVSAGLFPTKNGVGSDPTVASQLLPTHATIADKQTVLVTQTIQVTKNSAVTNVNMGLAPEAALLQLKVPNLDFGTQPLPTAAAAYSNTNISGSEANTIVVTAAGTITDATLADTLGTQYTVDAKLTAFKQADTDAAGLQGADLAFVQGSSITRVGMQASQTLFTNTVTTADYALHYNDIRLEVPAPSAANTISSGRYTATVEYTLTDGVN